MNYETLNVTCDVYIDVALVHLLLILNIFNTFFSISIVDLEQVNDCWGIFKKDYSEKFRKSRW